MKYESIEKAIEKINEQITALNNKIVDVTWIDKNFKKSEVKSSEKRIEALMNRKYELIELL